MALRSFFSKVDNFNRFKMEIGKNPIAYGIYYTIEIGADNEALSKGLWVAWSGDGSSSMDFEYIRECVTVGLEDVLKVIPDWHDSVDKYGRVKNKVIPGGLSSATGVGGRDTYLEDWFVVEDEVARVNYAKANDPISIVNPWVRSGHEVKGAAE